MEQWKVGEGGVREGIIRITLNIKENRNEREGGREVISGDM